MLVVDDSEILQDKLKLMLSSIAYIDIIGSAKDESEAIEQVNTLLPDVVILDLNLKTGSGVIVLRHTKKYHPEIKVMILTNHANDFYARACKNFHADRFLDKSFQFMEIPEILLSWLPPMQPHSGELKNAGQ